MTEEQVVTQLNTDATEALNLKNSITPSMSDFEDAKTALLAAVDSVNARISRMESNVNYAVEKFL